jgi:hypothetical protein
MVKRGKVRGNQENTVDKPSEHIMQVIKEVKDDLKNIMDSL